MKKNVGLKASGGVSTDSLGATLAMRLAPRACSINYTVYVATLSLKGMACCNAAVAVKELAGRALLTSSTKRFKLMLIMNVDFQKLTILLKLKALIIT